MSVINITGGLKNSCRSQQKVPGNFLNTPCGHVKKSRPVLNQADTHDRRRNYFFSAVLAFLTGFTDAFFFAFFFCFLLNFSKSRLISLLYFFTCVASFFSPSSCLYSA